MRKTPLAYLVFLKRDRRAVTAIEFALVAPVLLLLMMAIIEFALIFFASSVIENATTIGGRVTMTGSSYSADPTAARADYISQMIRTNSKGLLNPDQDHLHINTTVYNSFTDANNGSAPTTNNGYGNSGQTVLFNVTYDWHIITPIMKPFFTGGIFPLSAATLVQNENFASTSP